MKNSNFLTRRCLICKKHNKKSNFIRFYILDSELFLDIDQTKKTKGFYVCNNQEEINKYLLRYKNNKNLNIKINSLILEKYQK